MKNKELKIDYCPTGEMLGDFVPKPLQGSSFYGFRNEILGITAAKCAEYKTAYYEAKARNAATKEYNNG